MSPQTNSTKMKMATALRLLLLHALSATAYRLDHEMKRHLELEQQAEGEHLHESENQSEKKHELWKNKQAKIDETRAEESQREEETEAHQNSAPLAMGEHSSRENTFDHNSRRGKNGLVVMIGITDKEALREARMSPLQRRIEEFKRLTLVEQIIALLFMSMPWVCFLCVWGGCPMEKHVNEALAEGRHPDPFVTFLCTPGVLCIAEGAGWLCLIATFCNWCCVVSTLTVLMWHPTKLQVGAPQVMAVDRATRSESNVGPRESHVAPRESSVDPRLSQTQ